MCIVCSSTEVDAALKFLDTWERAQASMRATVEAMLQVRDGCTDPADRARYDRHHKRLVRAMHDWNRLDQLRETDVDKEDEA